MNLVTLHVPDRTFERVVSNYTFLEPRGWQEAREMRTANGRWYSGHGCNVGVSVQEEADGRRWLHVSASCRDRVPSYAELTRIKRDFIGANRKAVHVWPADAEHVNDHDFVLHLWSSLDADPLPDFRKWDEEMKTWRI